MVRQTHLHAIPMRMFSASVITLVVAGLCPALAHADGSQGAAPVADLSGLESMHATPDSNAAQSAPYAKMRAQAMMEAATALGAQHGLRWRAAQINAQLQQLAPRLARIYDFRPLMLDSGMVVPPVIEEARSTWSGDAAVARSAQVEYRIIAPARIAPIAPNWRNWLMQSVPAPMQPDPAVLPQTDDDRTLWREAVDRGWSAGVDQANAIFAVSLRRLQQDLTGMLLFLRLERQGMVSAPMLANGQVGVEVSGRALAIGQQIFRLTMGSSFLPTSRWTPVASSAPVLPGLADDKPDTAAPGAPDIGFVASPAIGGRTP